MLEVHCLYPQFIINWLVFVWLLKAISAVKKDGSRSQMGLSDGSPFSKNIMATKAQQMVQMLFAIGLVSHWEGEQLNLCQVHKIILYAP